VDVVEAEKVTEVDVDTAEDMADVMVADMEEDTADVMDANMEKNTADVPRASSCQNEEEERPTESSRELTTS